MYVNNKKCSTELGKKVKLNVAKNTITCYWEILSSTFLSLIKAKNCLIIHHHGKLLHTFVWKYYWCYSPLTEFPQFYNPFENRKQNSVSQTEIDYQSIQWHNDILLSVFYSFPNIAFYLLFPVCLNTKAISARFPIFILEFMADSESITVYIKCFLLHGHLFSQYRIPTALLLHSDTSSCSFFAAGPLNTSIA